MELKFNEPLGDAVGLFDSGVDSPYVARYVHKVVSSTYIVALLLLNVYICATTASNLPPLPLQFF